MMEKIDVRETFIEDPMILSVKDKKSLNEALNSEHTIVFLLFGDILTLDSLVQALLDGGKFPFIHVDLIAGLVSEKIVADYILEQYGGKCGIITTRQVLTFRAKEIGLPVIQRIFLLDSLSVEESLSSLPLCFPDAIEVIPGIIPKFLSRINRLFPQIPLIAGGMITEKEEVYQAISSGAMAVSTTKTELWGM